MRRGAAGYDTGDRRPRHRRLPVRKPIRRRTIGTAAALLTAALQVSAAEDFVAAGIGGG